MTAIEAEGAHFEREPPYLLIWIQLTATEKIRRMKEKAVLI